MPEQAKQFILIKTSPNDVLFTLRSISNPALTRQIHLTRKHPQQPLPVEWALSIIADQILYGMFKKGYFTFDRPEELAQIAFEQGYWFDAKFDFTPATKGDENLIFSILKVGNRAKIEEAIQKYGSNRVRDIAVAHLSDLTQNVIQLLEKMFKVQLVVDGVDEDMPVDGE